MVPFAFTGIVEGVGFVHRVINRRDLHLQALDRATTVGRPLVVVGAPSRGVVGNYPCGDLCVDLQGCTRCGAKPIDVEGVGAIPMESNSAVVFVSHVFEYTRDVDAAWREVSRVAGSDENVFVAHVQPWATWTNVLYPGSNWIVLRAPPHGKFTRRPLCRAPVDPRRLLVHP